MPHDFLIFDFGTNEEVAQQARHKVEGWTQGFRLGKKMLLKFEREAADDSAEPAKATAKPGAAHKKKSATKSEAAEPSGNVRVLVRLDFSDHEKLSLQRWLDRIPAEEPFKSAKAEIIRQGQPGFTEAAELFDSLS
ncbi:MAG: hypothetical protein ABSC10_05795 [Candidatus Acidiferrales bacterium]|jgi:hypothetical protein